MLPAFAILTPIALVIALLAVKAAILIVSYIISIA